jgi:hypothetical protein
MKMLTIQLAALMISTVTFAKEKLLFQCTSGPQKTPIYQVLVFAGSPDLKLVKLKVQKFNYALADYDTWEKGALLKVDQDSLTIKMLRNSIIRDNLNVGINSFDGEIESQGRMVTEKMLVFKSKLSLDEADINGIDVFCFLPISKQ